MDLVSGRGGTADLLVFQNYFSPSRHAIFEELGKSLKLLVLYMQSASDEGRQWIEEEPVHYRARRIPTRQLGKLVVPAGRIDLPERVAVAVMVDNNPTNVAMLLLARAVNRVADRSYLWVEHIPDPSKGRGKTLYQTTSSRALLRFVGGAVSFSAMSDTYLQGLGFTGVRKRVPQVVPPPPPGARGRPVETLRRFGYLGSAVARKNVDALREAVRGIENSEVALHLAGYPVADSAAHETSHGYVSGDSLEAFFSDIDVLVLPSVIDPWGLVVNEALMRGRLAIVSKFCGSCEIVRQIDPGLVCGLSAAEIRKAVTYALSLSAEEVGARLARAHEVMQGFTVQAAAEVFQHL